MNYGTALVAFWFIATAGIGCGGTEATSDGGITYADGAVVDAGPQDFPEAGLPVSRCYDGWRVRNDRTPCGCVRVCDPDSTYDGHYVCSLAQADNVEGPGNGAGFCLDGRCLDVPFGGMCTP